MPYSRLPSAWGLGLQSVVAEVPMAQTQALPTTMRAAAMDQFGTPDVVHTETLPVPSLDKHQVLVRVVAAGVGTWIPSWSTARFRIPRSGFLA